MMPSLYMIFDCEAVGLHGETFSCGYVVIDRAGQEVAHGGFACDPAYADGTETDRAWVKSQAPVPSFGYNRAAPIYVRYAFWGVWQEWRKQGAVLVADCAWPVETRFLAACVADSHIDRQWVAPYPLHEIATARMLAGFDPLATLDRLPNELPQHDPLADARQSARLWLEALQVLEASAHAT
jgi:hypothetical protein